MRIEYCVGIQSTPAWESTTKDFAAKMVQRQTSSPGDYESGKADIRPPTRRHIVIRQAAAFRRRHRDDGVP